MKKYCVHPCSKRKAVLIEHDDENVAVMVSMTDIYLAKDVDEELARRDKRERQLRERVLRFQGHDHTQEADRFRAYEDKEMAKYWSRKARLFFHYAGLIRDNKPGWWSES